MSRPDLNLLVTLDVLLAEGNVARAARRLRLSPSAMSRALARLRETTGDPLLVRAGRGLVPTPRALELRERVSQLVQDTEAVLRPAEQPNLQQLVRTFTLRTSEGFVENFGPDLIARVGEQAPGVRLCFVQKSNKGSGPLRDGTVDLEIPGAKRTLRWRATVAFTEGRDEEALWGYAGFLEHFSATFNGRERHLTLRARGPLPEPIMPHGR